MGIMTVPYPPYSPDFAPCDFWLFSKLRRCRYEAIEEMKEAVTKVIDKSHKRTSMKPSRSFWNGITNALQPGEITSKGLEFYMCSINKSANTKKVWKII